MPDTAVQPPTDLETLYPACFDPANPRPLKIGIHRDLIAIARAAARAALPADAGKTRREAVRKRIWRLIKQALADYCTRPEYLRSLTTGAARIGLDMGSTLDGQAAGEVTEREADIAAMTLRGETPPPYPALAPLPELPKDAPLTEENIVSGRLKLTVKFSDLPKPMAVKDGMKIGIRTESALVVATLPPKAWKKLAKAAGEWPQWVAALTGKLGATTGANGSAVVLLEQPALQVFEKKAKPAAG